MMYALRWPRWLIALVVVRMQTIEMEAIQLHKKHILSIALNMPCIFSVSFSSDGAQEDDGEKFAWEWA